MNGIYNAYIDKIKVENRIQKRLAKYDLKVDGFSCPSCGFHTLLFVLDESDNKKQRFPKDLRKYIGDDHSFKCLNCSFYGLINDF